MRVRLIMVLFLMLTIPMVGLGWLGVSIYHQEQTLEKHRYTDLHQDKLRDIDDILAKLIGTYERHLNTVLNQIEERPDAIRTTIATERLIRQLFVMNKKGVLTHPAGNDLSAAEQAFVSRTHPIFSRGNIFQKPSDSPKKTQRCDWLVWHYEEGVQLLYWCSVNGAIHGAELSPVVVASDMIAALPDGTLRTRHRIKPFRVRLLDANNRLLYQWGEYTPPENDIPLATIKLSPPLSAFRLTYHTAPPPDETFGRSAALGLVLGFFALLFSVALLGIYFVRESSRDARTARDRMTFVNQVSHELKTPLTNLRMYAELLGEYLEEEDEKGHRYVNVIVQESERLSRLIGNVLSFARHARGKLTIRKSNTIPDQIILDTVERFIPVFKQAGIEIELDLNAKSKRLLDGDALAQIVANLLSNVEKYAPLGKWAHISSRIENDRLIVEVKDRGEGIPDGQMEAVFKPFFRLSNKLTDRAAGTGIGLSISRELARRHGGDLTIISSPLGAAFRIVFSIPSKGEPL